jgi:acetyl esterase/lipase
MDDTHKKPTCQMGLTYALAEGAPLCGDLYLPQGSGPFPALIAVPGGAWRMCVRNSWKDWGYYLAERGYAVFAIDYRTATATQRAFPEAVCDVLASVRFLRGEAQKFWIDPDRIGIFGASAGAHLGALAALAAEDHPLFQPSRALNPYGNVSAQIKTLVAAYGIYDLFRHWQDDLKLNPAGDANVVRNFLGSEPFQNQQLYFDASPVRHVHYGRKLSALIAWGTADELVNPAQSEDFVRVLQQARIPVFTHRAVGASHFWVNLQPLSEPTSDSAVFAPRVHKFLSLML